MTEQEAILAVNDAYYDAFAAADFEAMSHIWAEGEVSCVHPGWPVLIGRETILDSYRSIFRNPHQERVQPHNAKVVLTNGDGRVFCIEIVGRLALMATNWFKLVEGRWRLVHHQASPITVPSYGEGSASDRLN